MLWATGPMGQEFTKKKWTSYKPPFGKKGAKSKRWVASTKKSQEKHLSKKRKTQSKPTVHSDVIRAREKKRVF